MFVSGSRAIYELGDDLAGDDRLAGQLAELREGGLYHIFVHFRSQVADEQISAHIQSRPILI